MPIYKIADLSVEISQLESESFDWYAPYLTDEAGDVPQIKLSTTHEEIERYLRHGVGFTPYTAENTILAQQFHRHIQLFDGGHIHSSAVLYRGRVYLFSADSGVGKSTLTERITKLCREAVIINDDKPSFRIIGGKCIVYGTPFSGGTGKQINAKAELGGIFFLERSDNPEISEITSSEKITCLLQQTTRIPEQTYSDKLLSMLALIIENYPIYKFKVTDDDFSAETAVNFLNSIRS